MTVTDRDRGYKALLAGMRMMRNVEVLVGVDASTGASRRGGASMVTIAAANEFGTADGHIPERSFLRSTMDEQQQKYIRQFSRLAVRVTSQRGSVLGASSTLRKGLRRIGRTMQRDVQRKITVLADPPNAPSTIAAKGSDNPLVDTGRLRLAIDFKVQID
jgi:hypothetical protein